MGRLFLTLFIPEQLGDWRKQTAAHKSLSTTEF